jgi:membrane dipeptidase
MHPLNMPSPETCRGEPLAGSPAHPSPAPDPWRPLQLETLLSTKSAALAVLLAVLPVAAGAAPVDPETARKLHFDSIVIDTHDDTTQRMLDPAFDLGVHYADGSIDIPRMREGGLDAIFFSIWVDGKVTGEEAVTQALRQIDAVRFQVMKQPRDLVLVTTADSIRKAAAEGRIAVLMGVEGGHMIANDLANLRKFFDLGVRYMTLTHMVNTDWADSSTDMPKSAGLSDFGREVVRAMNRLGMMVDVSHVSDATFDDVLEVSKAPVIASHSSARALSHVPRNLNDRMIRDLGAHGGVMQVNYHMGYLSQAFTTAVKANDGRIDKAIEAEAEERCGDDDACQTIAGSEFTRKRVEAGTLPRVEWTQIVNHIDHAAKVAGADHVGLGSDFDGANMPYGMEDVAGLPKITQALLERGYKPEQVRGILGGNLLRVMEQVEAVAAGR